MCYYWIFDYFKNLGIRSGGCWCDDQPWNDVRYLPKKVKDAVLEKLSRYKNTDKQWLNKFNDILIN